MSSFEICVLNSLRSIIYCIRSTQYSFSYSSFSMLVFFTIRRRFTMKVGSRSSDFSGMNLQRRRLLGRALVKKGLKTKGVSISHRFMLSSMSPMGSIFSPKSKWGDEYSRRWTSTCEAWTTPAPKHEWARSPLILPTADLRSWRSYLFWRFGWGPWSNSARLTWKVC